MRRVRNSPLDRTSLSGAFCFSFVFSTPHANGKIIHFTSLKDADLLRLHAHFNEIANVCIL